MSDTSLILPLHGDNVHSDADAICHLFNRGSALDLRTNQVIVAPTLRDLPPGLYLLANALPTLVSAEKPN